MKKLILAVLLALTPVSSFAALPLDTDVITQSEIEGRAMICLDLINLKITRGEVFKNLELDTGRKQRDFLLQCQMFILGAQVGMHVEMEKHKT